MNRRTWIGTVIGGLVGLCLPKTKAAPTNKLGYVSVGVYHDSFGRAVRPGDIEVRINGQKPPKWMLIQSAHDIEGWYEYIVDREYTPMSGWNRRYREHGDVELICRPRPVVESTSKELEERIRKLVRAEIENQCRIGGRFR